MKLEDRLRQELERSGRSTRVGVAPSVDELATIARQRQGRNRRIGSVAAAVFAGVLLVGAVVSTRPDDQQVVVADGGTDAAAPDELSTSEPAVVAEAGDTDAAVGEVADVSDQIAVDDVAADEVVDDDSSDESIGTGIVNEPTPLEERAVDDVVVPSDLDALDRVLQGSPAALNVSTRASAVEFAGGSGVLLVAAGDGYRGLATSFAESGGEQIGLSSINGLDWVEVEVQGVPDGATATTVRAFDGGYVALFDRFDPDSGTKQMFVGTSTDLATWELSEPLEGFDVVATDLAVGANGVMVIGDEFAPDVWFGPIGGPYELTGRLEVSMLFGVTTVGDEFLIAGRSPDGASIFRSSDGRSWERSQLSVPGDGELGVTVADGTIIVSTMIDRAPATVLSSDGGTTWDLLGEGELRSLSVNGSTLGFLGGTDGDPSITLAEDGSFATANLEVAAPDRLALLSTTSSQAVMLVNGEDNELTWVLASR